ncbi:MAG: hypothetical protein JXA41_02525, partial [Deltaproteobacteria bacterium]|nr:hypothetical protein [Deltaproteobacteria bacterium]
NPQCQLRLPAVSHRETADRIEKVPRVGAGSITIDKSKRIDGSGNLLLILSNLFLLILVNSQQ